MINFKKFGVQFAIAGLMVGAITAPTVSQAQTVTHWVNRQLKVDDNHSQTYGQRHRHSNRNSDANGWRNLSYAGGGIAVAGILTGNSTLVAIGVTGGLYSTYRYEQDRNSGNAGDRRRFAYFSQTSRTINGHPYRRVTVMSNGHHYYAYKRAY